MPETGNPPSGELIDTDVKFFCRKCGHYIGKLKNEEGQTAQIICHSCKTNNSVTVQVKDKRK
jgi:hypothetical protein